MCGWDAAALMVVGRSSVPPSAQGKAVKDVSVGLLAAYLITPCCQLTDVAADVHHIGMVPVRAVWPDDRLQLGLD